MGEIEIIQGRVYRAKKPAMAGHGYFNDRAVLRVWPDRNKVQYDGPSVGDGRHYPTIALDKFVAWAGEDVTDKLPEGEWERWS